MRRASLNHCYRLVWNERQRAWVAVSEIAKVGAASATAKKLASVLGLTTALHCALADADVLGGVITGGNGSISQSTDVTTIYQQSQQLHLTWDQFNIGKQQTVQFIQPNQQALAVNTILDSNGSSILGRLNANGQVWLINPNGIFFGRSAEVNVGAILAATLNPLSPSGSAEQLFGNGGTGRITNLGSIRAAKGGYVALIANQVRNLGTIQAPQGTVALVGGSQVTLSFAEQQLFNVRVDQSTLNALVENKQLIQANGGAVWMTAGAKDSLLQSVVNNQGIVEATAIENKAGKIILLSGKTAGTTQVGGQLNASAAIGEGGFIETSGATVNIADDSVITTKAYRQDGGLGNTGVWLIDPLDFVVAKSGGNITGQALSARLQDNHATIETDNSSGAGNGDILINDFVEWSADTTLTVNAYRNIEINRTMTSTGANGKLALKYGQWSNDGGKDGVVASYQVSAKVNLQEGQHFSTQLGRQGNINQYTVITRLGEAGSATGTDLQGISSNPFGLFVLGADIDASATRNWDNGFNPIGGGQFNGLSNFFMGIFDGLGHVITNLYINRPSQSDVGLFAQNFGVVQNVGLQNAAIVGGDGVGGIAGRNLGFISGSFVNGNLSGQYDVGGLVGVNGGFINNSYARGEVTGGDNVGGLVGVNALTLYTGNDEDFSMEQLPGNINNSYADTKLTLIDTCGSFCEIVNAPNKGGLVGANTNWQGVEGNVSNSFWNRTTESSDNGIGNGLTASQMQSPESFTDWPIDAVGGSGKVWRIYSGHTAPLLRSFMQYQWLETVSLPFSGALQTAGAALTPLQQAFVFGQPSSGTQPGTYQNSDLWSSQLGYDFAGGALEITQAQTPPTLPNTRTPDLTNPITNIQQPPKSPPANNNNTVPPINVVDVNITPSAGPDDDEPLYDVIQTYGCGV